MGRVDKVKKILNFFIVPFNIILTVLGVSWITGFNIWVILKNLSIIGIITIISIRFFLFINKRLWKFKFFKILLDSPPNLNGKWEGEIINTKDNKSQKMEMFIDQTYLEVYVKVLVERGDSITWVGDIIKINNNDWELIWNWRSSNEKGEFSGTTILNILNEEKMEGFYYTNSNIDGRGCTAGRFVAKK